MNADFAWGYMITVLSGNFKPLDEAQAAAQAASTALYLAQDAGLVSKTPRIHLAAKAE